MKKEKNPANVQRYAMVIGLKSEEVERYRQLHADVWPEVLMRIRASNICNYSIHLVELKTNEYYLFSYFEYTGVDFERDMADMAADDDTIRWWRETDPTQVPIQTSKAGDHWTRMEEVFYAE